MTDTRVGRYRLDGVLGVGSFATVHKARDDRLEADVVVKVLAENHSLNPEIRERFIAEGRSLRRVDSPYVVTVHDIGESERQQPYLVLEHADRGTLADRVRELRAQGWRATPGDVLALARSLAAALEAVHGAHLVHRDLSPSNVLIRSVAGAPERAATGRLIRPDEQVLLADLGMCKDLALNSGLTVSGGTAGFRPPEMTGGPAIIDTRADLWSLSALVSWVSEEGDLPEALPTALRRSLADAPMERHPDVAAWLADVEASLATGEGAEEPVPAHTAASGSPQHPVSGAANRTSSWRRWAVTLLAGLLLGTGLGVGATRWVDAPTAATQSARIAIEGPERIEVGAPATFTARLDGVGSWVWVLPTGEHVANTETVTITARTAGSAVLTLRSRDGAGTELAVRQRVDVTDRGTDE